MNEEKYNLLYALNRNVNDSYDSVDKVLSEYFIKNWDKASEFNIYEIAAECSVSRASIRRFAEKLGYGNFQNLKRMMIINNRKTPNIAKENFRKLLTESIVSITEELDERMDSDQVRIICDEIKHSNNFYIFSSGQSFSAAKDFQVKLAEYGKIAKLIYRKDDLDFLIENGEQNDLILVISITGKLAIEHKKSLKDLKCKKILVTVNRLIDFTPYFTKCYFLSHLDHSTNASMYRKYGLNYFLDILANEYI